MPVYASVSAAAADAADAADSAAAAAASKIAVAGSSNGHRHIKTPAPPVINIVEHPEPVHPFDEGEVARENGEVEAQAAAAAAAAAADAAAGRV
jgi:hypothetical protein